jgi:hypothetical protein
MFVHDNLLSNGTGWEILVCREVVVNATTARESSSVYLQVSLLAELQIRFNPFADGRAGSIHVFGRNELISTDICCAA